MRIDISGNWIWTDAPERGLIVSQPNPPVEGNLFFQDLVLPAGAYYLHIVYKAELDHSYGKAVFGNFDCHPITVNGIRYEINLTEDEDSGEYRGMLRFIHHGGSMRLETRVQDTHCFNATLLEIDCDDSAFSRTNLYALENDGNAEVTVVRGIPFLSAHHAIPIRMWGYGKYRNTLDLPEPEGQLADWSKGSISCGNVPVDTLYCLGMTHCYDIANGSWYHPTDDFGMYHFIGDHVGSMELTFADGEIMTLPLVYGLNVWYGMPWDLVWNSQNNWSHLDDIRESDSLFFARRECDRMTVQKCVGLDDGIRRMGEETNERYVFALRLGGRKLSAFRILPEEGKYGIVTVSAVTLRTSNVSQSLHMLPDISSSDGRLTVHDPENILSGAYLDDIERLQRVFYTFTDELPVLSAPIVPAGYFGPRYDFASSQDAILAATYLYRNGPDCASYISDYGMSSISPTARSHIACYVNGIGVVQPIQSYYDGTEDFLRRYRDGRPGEFPGCGGGWTRGIGELMRETAALGYDKYLYQFVDWLDRALFDFASPPHWKRILLPIAEGHTERMVGDTKETGNRENDGHGICMWGRGMVWLKSGRDAKWNEAHWEATKAACDWIRWQLDTDMLFPGVRKDVLYTESECVHGGYEVYSSGNCLHGLRLSILMAEQIGKTAEAEQWKALYNRLANGMLEHLQSDSTFGAVWYTDPGCDWQDHAHKMVHLQLAPDGITYTPLEDYTDGTDALMLEIDRNCYKLIMSRGTYNFLRMYGYGQGMMTQSALLLDEMHDAEQMLHLMLTHAYLPKMESFLAPEGIMTHPCGKFYLPVNGYLGQDAHIADSVKAVRLMLGVDDNKENLIRLIPRFPSSWERCGIDEYPVLTPCGRGKLSYLIRRTETSYRMQINISAPSPLEVRIGPFDRRPSDTVRINGKNVPLNPYRSGDSWWCMISSLNGSSFVIETESA